jgi:hypothetical protein
MLNVASTNSVRTSDFRTNVARTNITQILLELMLAKQVTLNKGIQIKNDSRAIDIIINAIKITAVVN